MEISGFSGIREKKQKNTKKPHQDSIFVEREPYPPETVPNPGKGSYNLECEIASNRNRILL